MQTDVNPQPPTNAASAAAASAPIEQHRPSALPRLAIIGPVPPWQGGIAQHTAQLRDQLAKTHQLLTISFTSMYPDWLYPGPTNDNAAEKIGKAEVAEPHSASEFLIHGMHPRSWRQAVSKIAAFQPEAVILPWWTVFWTPYCVYTVRALRRRGIATVFLCHNVSDHEDAWWKQRLAMLALSPGAAYVAHTNATKKRLRALLPSAAVNVYPHPLYQHFPAPARVPTRRATLELLFFGYLRHYKGVDLLIEALGQLPDLDFHLQIAGECWIELSSLRARIEQLGFTERVTIVPRYVDDQQAAGMFTLADALVLPYREASGSGVAALALHYHTPVVASRVGGLAESIIEGETGMLVPPGDPAALATAIQRLQQSRDWPALIAKHQQAATWQGLAAAIEQSIASITPPDSTIAETAAANEPQTKPQISTNHQQRAIGNLPRMRILLTSPYPLWPETSGGVRRTLGIARALSAAGHRVKLLSPGTPPPATAGDIEASLSYPAGGRPGHFFNPGFSRALRQALTAGQDLLIAGFPYQAHSLTRLCRRHHTTLIYDAHNLEAERFASLGNPLVTALVSHSETHLVRRADAVLAVSPDDQQSFVQRYGRQPLLLPNGVDDQTFVPGHPDQRLLEQLGLAGKRIALYCGSFDYQPNIDAVATLLKSDWPQRATGLHDTHLLVVGRQPPAFIRNRPGVVVTGEVEDLLPYLQLAHLVLAPLTSGGGTRLKIIEALACGQHVLSTSFGAAGLSSQPVPGLQLCELAEFPAQLQHRLQGRLQPGSNTAGRRWATGMSWRSLVSNINWHAIASPPTAIPSTR